MKFHIKCAVIKEIAAGGSRILDRNPLLPIFSCIKFTVTQGQLSVFVTDGVISLQQIVPSGNELQVEESGDFVTNGMLFFEMLRKWETDMLCFEIKGKELHISAEKMHMRLVLIDVLEYPDIDFDIQTGDILQLHGKELKDLISQTLFAASEKNSRPVLGGLNLKTDKGILQCCATDSYRLAMKDVSVTFPLEELDVSEITIPKKALLSLLQFLNTKETIEISMSRRKVQFLCENAILQSTLLEGVYPDVRKLLPPEAAGHIVRFQKNLLLAAVDRCLFIKSDGVSIVHLHMQLEHLTVKAYDAQIGASEERLPIDYFDDEVIDIAVNGLYLLEALKALPGQDIRMYIQDALHPFILKDREEPELLQLLLPIRIHV